MTRDSESRKEAVMLMSLESLVRLGRMFDPKHSSFALSARMHAFLSTSTSELGPTLSQLFHFINPVCDSQALTYVDVLLSLLIFIVVIMLSIIVV
ncbi:hypothetical protein [Acinetobacter baumannii]|uniref:hypothetical protein n=1 Tax=Acinetobacter baumannii TaxID=470 RepID=UPI003394D654